MAEDRPRKLVVAALIADQAGRILLTQRREDQELPLQWEFPGGKVEPGEPPDVALARELREELDVSATIGRIWDVLFHAYPRYDVYMLVYRCTLPPGATPRPVEVLACEWIPIPRLRDYPILPADEPLIRRLESGT